VDEGFQPHPLPLSVKGNSNVPLRDFQEYLPELHTKLSYPTQNVFLLYYKDHLVKGVDGNDRNSL